MWKNKKGRGVTKVTSRCSLVNSEIGNGILLGVSNKEKDISACSVT